MDATCVGSCKRLFIVGTLVVDREVLLLPSSLRTIDSAQRSERGSGLVKEVKLKGGARGLPGERAKERQGWICDESAEVWCDRQ